MDLQQQDLQSIIKGMALHKNSTSDQHLKLLRGSDQAIREDRQHLIDLCEWERSTSLNLEGKICRDGYTGAITSLRWKKRQNQKSFVMLSSIWCPEIFVPGHVCKKKQLFMIEVEGEEEDSLLVQEDLGEEPHISIHALTGIHSFSTMKVVGSVGNRQLQILIDLGSTHNFNNCQALVQSTGGKASIC